MNDCPFELLPVTTARTLVTYAYPKIVSTNIIQSMIWYSNLTVVVERFDTYRLRANEEDRRLSFSLCILKAIVSVTRTKRTYSIESLGEGSSEFCLLSISDPFYMLIIPHPLQTSACQLAAFWNFQR